MTAKRTLLVDLVFGLRHVLLQLAHSHPKLLQGRCHVLVFETLHVERGALQRNTAESPTK